MRIANASGFYGDRFSAMREMLTGGPIDVLTGDYLAELTMLILGRDRLKDPSAGYAKTFLRQAEDCLALALERNVRIVTNAGGLNPAGLREALAKRFGARTAHVEGDNLKDRFPDALTANAYLGAWGIAACLDAGADVVVTGRVTDASLVVGAAAWHHKWARDDWDALAGATVAGHLIECGAQVTGGNFAFFTELGFGEAPGFPIAEVAADGSAVITKHAGTGGAVTVETVTAQLLYEIGGPLYLGPDVATRLGTVRLRQEGPDRVRVSGTTGAPPPSTLKVALNTLGGFRNTVTFVLTGLDIDAKAALVRHQLTEALGDDDGLTWTLARTDRPDAPTEQTASALLTVTAKHQDATRVGRTFSQAAVGLALASYPGFRSTAPPGDATPYGVYKAEFVPQDSVRHTAVLPDGTTRDIPPPKTANPPSTTPADPAKSAHTQERTRRLPLGTIIGARSGDKGGDANLGVWARSDAAYEWLCATVTVEELRRLLPEARELAVTRYELPNVRGLNFVIEGLLGEGVASSTRFDPQAKALGEWLRARHVDIPEALL